MKTLDQGKDKIKKICDVLRDETLEPAKKEADDIIKGAQSQAEQIIAGAEKEAEKILAEAKQQVEQERNVFQSSLLQATKQGLEALRQSIEHKLFNQQLKETLEIHTSDPKVVSHLITAIINGIEKDGLAVDLTALIPRTVTARDINQLLAEEVLKKLRDHSVAVGNFTGGAQVKLNERQMTVEITDEALKELLANYIRKDFRKMIFAC